MELKELLADTDNDWMLQSVIDTLAISRSLPLRLLHLDEFKNLYRHFYQADNDWFKHQYPEKKSFDSFCTNLVDWADEGFCCEVNDYKQQLDALTEIYDNFSYKIFPILPAKLHSLEFLSQTVIKSWRIFSVLYLYHELCMQIQKEEKQKVIENFYGLKFFNLSYLSIPDYRKELDYKADQSLLLLVGPVFIQEQEALLDENIHDDTVYATIQKVLNDFAQSRQDNIHIRESYFRQAMHRETIYCEEYVKNHINSVVEAWQALLKAQIKGHDKITPKQLKLLSLWSILNTHSRYKKNNYNIDQQALYLSNDEHCQGKNSHLYFKLIHRDPFIQDNKPQENKPTLYADFNYSLENFEQSSLNDPLGGKFLKIFRAFDRKYRQLNSNRLLILELWLNGVFSGLVSEEGEIRKQLAAWICAVMRADIAEIIDYHPQTPEKPLRETYIFSRKNKYQACTQELREKLENLTESFQLKSSIYQSIKTGKSKLCPDRGCGDCTLITYSQLKLKNIPNEKSELVIPIKFNGRVLGIVEVASFTSWRLGVAHRSILSSIATQLAAYWYQARYFDALKTIQKEILNFYTMNEAISEAKLYNEICKQSATLFLSLGSGLWIKDENSGTFTRKGFHQVEISKNQIDPSQNNKIAKIVKETEKALDQSQGIPHFNIPKEEFDQLDSKNRDILINKGIQCIHYIPIINYSDRPKVIAILSIYDDTSQGYDDSWKYISQFYSDHLSGVIDSILTHLKNQTTRIALFEHELRDAVSHLTYKALKTLTPLTKTIDIISKNIDVLNNPKFEQYIFRAKLFGDLSDTFNLKELQQSIYKLKNTINLPVEDIRYLAQTLEHKITVIDKKKLNQYAEAHREEIRSLIAVTDEPDFVDFVLQENLFDISEEEVNLKEVINLVIEGSNTPRLIDGNSLDRVIRIKKQALVLVLRNLWENAQKYRTKKGEAIIIEATISRTRALLLTISNPSKQYKDDELRHLTEPGFRTIATNVLGNTHSLNQGLGLYLVSNLCKHIMGISFKIIQEKRSNNNYQFIVTLRFSPAKII